MAQQITQTFERGQRADVDPSLQPQGTYRVARNGRVLLNPDDDEPLLGKGGTFVNSPGNKRLLTLPAGQQFLAGADASMGTVICSTDGTRSQIGLWAFDGPDGTVGAYRVIYDDEYDPHLRGQPYRRRRPADATHARLGWKLTDDLDVEVMLDSPQREKFCWTNRRGVDHTLNLRAIGTRLTDGYYPARWSVHQFRYRPDVVFPKIKLLGRCAGRLPAGSYQVAVQYVSPDGVRSCVSPITERVFVTDQPLDVPDPVYQVARRASHHNRVMTASGGTTTEGLAWELSGLDVRWDRLRLVVLYYQRDGLPTQIMALPPVALSTVQTVSTFTGNQLRIELAELVGEELTVADLQTRHETLARVQSIRTDRKRLVRVGIDDAPVVQAETKGLRYVPVTKTMGADRTATPRFQLTGNDVTGLNDGDPLTNSNLVTETVLRRLYGDLYETYTITDDYANDKGQVWEWLHRSNFRGETYEYAVATLDRQGQVLFVTPGAAYTFPQQYDKDAAGNVDAFTLTADMAGFDTPQPRLLGLSISNLLLPVKDLYDADGELNVSGFMIVRRARRKRLLHQGVIFPVCRTDYCAVDDGSDDKLFPLPLHNWFEHDSALPNRFEYPTLTNCKEDRNGWKPSRTFSQPNYFTYHSPDVLIEATMGAYPDLKEGDQLRHVGVVHQNANQPVGELGIFSGTTPTHFYVKSYDTSTLYQRLAVLQQRGRPKIGATTRLTVAKRLDGQLIDKYKDIDKTALNLFFRTEVHPQWPTTADGIIQRNAVLMKATDWRAVDAAPIESYPHGYRLANFEQVTPIAAQTNTGEVVGEPYFSIGHFQPLTQAWLDKAVAVNDATGKLTHYRFDDIEVWGGDAYVQFFDLARIYPYTGQRCDKTDYAVGHIVPIETKYNLMLRPGRTLARNAFRPDVAGCENILQQTQNGIMPSQPEDWNYNRALLVTTEVVAYQILPPDVTLSSQQPAGIAWTPPGHGGQYLDAWRGQLPGDRGQLDARLGAAMQLVRTDGMGLYVFMEGGISLVPIEAMQLSSGNGGVVQTDSGAVFRQEVPISRRYGTQHPSSCWVQGSTLGCWDARMGVLVRVTGGLDLLSLSEGLDDRVKALSAPLRTAVAGAGSYRCVAGVDPQTHEVLFTFQGQTIPTQTLVYQPDQSAFIGEFDVPAARYFRRGGALFSSEAVTLSGNSMAGRVLWQHNVGLRGQWYGRFYPTVLTAVVAPRVDVAFDYSALAINQEAVRNLVRITLYSAARISAQEEHTLLPREDIRFYYRDHQLEFPLYEWTFDEQKRPITGKALLVVLTVENDAANQSVEIQSLSTWVRR